MQKGVLLAGLCRQDSKAKLGNALPATALPEGSGLVSWFCGQAATQYQACCRQLELWTTRQTKWQQQLDAEAGPLHWTYRPRKWTTIEQLRGWRPGTDVDLMAAVVHATPVQPGETCVVQVPGTRMELVRAWLPVEKLQTCRCNLLVLMCTDSTFLGKASCSQLDAPCRMVEIHSSTASTLLMARAVLNSVSGAYRRPIPAHAVALCGR